MNFMENFLLTWLQVAGTEGCVKVDICAGKAFQAKTASYPVADFTLILHLRLRCLIEEVLGIKPIGFASHTL